MESAGRYVALPTCVQSGMDETEREAIRVERLDPDDPAVVTAIDCVRWQLSLYFDDQDTGASNFWPIWPILGAAIGLISHAVAVQSAVPRHLTS